MTIKIKGEVVTELSISLDQIVKDLSLGEKAEVVTLILGVSRGYSDGEYKQNREEIEGVIRLLPRDQKVYLIKILAEGLVHN